MTLSLTVSVLAPAAESCTGYSDGASRSGDAAADAARPAVSEPDAGQQVPTAPPPGAALDAGSALPGPKVDSPDASSVARPTPTPKPAAPDAGRAPEQDAGASANLRVTHSALFASYLSDYHGQPLYMFAADVAGLPETSCLDDCARQWPPFDVEVAQPSAAFDRSEVSRFHRQDGKWQTTYKGHALYYRASEADSIAVTGDAADARWFVARDYLAFLGAARTFAPAGGTTTNDTFLTDGFGRTLYVCLDDQPRTASSEAISSCDTLCTVDRPIFAAAATGRTTLLPSLLDSADLRELVRPDGQRQLMYRGWPLYYYSSDISPGSTAGHNDKAWRAINPVSFGKTPEAGASN